MAASSDFEVKGTIYFVFFGTVNGCLTRVLAGGGALARWSAILSCSGKKTAGIQQIKLAVPRSLSHSISTIYSNRIVWSRVNTLWSQIQIPAPEYSQPHLYIWSSNPELFNNNKNINSSIKYEVFSNHERMHCSLGIHRPSRTHPIPSVSSAKHRP